MAAGEFRKQRRLGPDGRQNVLGGQTSVRACRDIIGTRGDQDMRRLIQVPGTEALPVPLVEPEAGRLIRLWCHDLTLDQRPHRRLLVGLGAPFCIAKRLGFDPEPRRFLQQQFTHHQRPRRRLPRQDRLFRRMVLHLAGNHLAWNDLAVDADRPRLRQRIRQ